MSETTSLISINGEVLPYRKISLNSDGVFLVGGKTLCLGLFENQKLKLNSDEWYQTHDQGVQLPSGTFQFVKRNDLIFISGGEKINPLLIEEIIQEIPEIEVAYLITLPDEVWGEMGVLLYQGEVSTEKIKAFLKNRLHPFMIPKFIFQTDLSHSGQLKPRRHELKNLAYSLYLHTIISHDYIPGKEVAKPLMVFFHGFMGDKGDLREIGEKLSSMHSVLYIDLPGHGDSKIKNFHSLEDMFIKLRDFLLLKANHFIFYGYSMGGRLALQLSLDYLAPESLILESAGFGLMNQNAQDERMNQDLNLLQGIEVNNLPDFFLEWYGNPIFANYKNLPRFKSDCQKKAHHEILEWRDSQKILSIGAGALRSVTLKKLGAAQFPILYFYGELDLKYKAEASELKQIGPLIQVHEIPDTGHNPHKTHPADILNILNNTLK